MKGLLRLYPPSWRKRYGREMEALVEDMPGEVRISLDLVLGAAAAYAAVIRGNRILSTAGSFLNAVGAAALLQAIAFVLFVMVARNSPGPKYLAIGPIALAQLWYPALLGIPVRPALLSGGLDWLVAPSLLVGLICIVVVLLAAPRVLSRAIESRARPTAARTPAGARPRRQGRRGSPSRRGA